MNSEETELLREFATTDRQLAHLQAVADNGNNIAHAAVALGITRGGVTSTIQLLRKRATYAGHPDVSAHVPAGFHLSKLSTQTDKSGAVKGRSVQSKPGIPEEASPIPEGHEVKGISRLVNADGEMIQEWIKTKAGPPEAKDVATACREALSGWVPPPMLPVEAPVNADQDMLAVIHLGDAHVNMYAAKAEGGHDFNLDIAERELTMAMRLLIDKLNPAGECLIQQLGDFLHNNDQSNGTPKNGNQLDVAGRFWQALRAGVQLHVAMVQMALTKFDRVYVRVNPGNHDEDAAYGIAIALEMRFHDEPRVTVVPSEHPYYIHIFGDNLVATTHGHKAKGKDIPGLIAATYWKQWGATVHRRCDVGHVHHEDTKEYPGMLVKYHPTLAPKDAYHAGRYDSKRKITATVFHRERGEVDHPTVTMEYVRIALAAQDAATPVPA